MGSSGYLECKGLQSYLDFHQGKNATNLTGPYQETYDNFQCDIIINANKSNTPAPSGYDECKRLLDYLNAHQGKKATFLTGPYQAIFDGFNCNQVFKEQGNKPNPNQPDNKPPSNDTPNPTGDSGGAVFVFVLAAGVGFVGFMWYKGYL